MNRPYSFRALRLAFVDACGCHADGSLGVSCDENGCCECRPGVLGVKCDQCGENRFNLSAGCT
ncbi:laminin subunit gamma-1-like, partial [Paramuricea clavata]